jgi:hypothetical protein
VRLGVHVRAGPHPCDVDVFVYVTVYESHHT